MHTVVMLNGGTESGKTTFAEELRQLYNAHLLVHGVQEPAPIIESHILPLRAMLFAFADVHFGRPVERTIQQYNLLKKHDFGGFVGRDLLFILGDVMRAKDVTLLSNQLFGRIMNRPQPQLIIVDDLGFEHELAFASHVEGIQLRTVYLGRRIDPGNNFVFGEAFPGDIRVCLRDLCEHCDPDPLEYARHIFNSRHVERVV